MASRSYPFPFSTPISPHSLNDALLPVTTSMTESSSRDAQIIFHEAPVTLEAAGYDRARRRRRSTLEVVDSATSGERRSRSSEAGYLGSDDNLSALAPSDTREPSSPTDSHAPLPPQHSAVRPLNTSSRRLNRDLPPLRTAIPARDISDSPSVSQAPYPHLSRSQLENRFQRHREYLADDASTTLGRRVAAREAARASTSSGTSTLIPLSRFEGNFVQLIATMEREFDHLRQQRSDLSRTLSPDTRAPPLSRRTIELRRQLAAHSREASSPASGSLVPQTDLLRRRLIPSVFPSRTSTLSSRSERLSILSNFSSVQNLPTPVSTSSRSLLFEEPISYLQTTDASSEGRSDTWSSSEYDPDFDRRYVVRRRFNADGEEHVHPINLEWLNEPPIYVGQGTRRVAQRGQPEAVSQRRRGWARLDLDGNEIPFEQEEEVERTRSLETQSRNSLTQTDPGFHSLQAPTTSTSLAPEDDYDRIPRVRLNNLDSQQYRVSVVDDVDLKGLEKVPTNLVEPFRPCPLPTPLKDMTWTPPSRKPSRPNRVSRHANFAGR